MQQMARPTAMQMDAAFKKQNQLGRARAISQSFKEKSPVRPREPPPPPPPNKQMYDLAEHDERKEEVPGRSSPIKILHTFNTGSLKKLRPSSKPPVASTSSLLSKSAERSKSFNPKSRQRQLSGFLNRSLSQLPKSFSHNSLDRGAARLSKAAKAMRRTPSVEAAGIAQDSTR
jgi:hypothetical protein